MAWSLLSEVFDSMHTTDCERQARYSVRANPPLHRFVFCDAAFTDSMDL